MLKINLFNSPVKAKLIGNQILIILLLLQRQVDFFLY